MALLTKKKTVKLSSLKSSLQKEREGEWIAAPDIGPEVRFLVRSTNFPDFTAARDEVTQKLTKKFDGGRIPEEVLAKANGELLAEHILLGWEGLDEEFSQDLALSILSDEEHRVMRTGVLIAAAKVGRADVEFVEGGAKN